MKCQIVQFPFHVLMSYLQTNHQCRNVKMKTGQIAASDGGIKKADPYNRLQSSFDTFVTF